MLRTKTGQSTLEFSVFAIVVIGALLTMQIYIKRGVQGRWRESIDDIGEQYDPRHSDNLTVDTQTATAVTNIFLEEQADGFTTMREDTVHSVEEVSGTRSITAP